MMIDMLKKIPSAVKRYAKMTKREKWNELYSNLWMTPMIYAVLSLILVFITLWADLKMNVYKGMPSFLIVDYGLTKTILSTLTAGILSLTTFTFYGVLGALSTFSSQFSPRILKNFMMNAVTQRTLGIFSGSFLYVLFCLFFINEDTAQAYSLIPTAAVLTAMITISTFAFFINHIVTWLQVTNLAEQIKRESVDIIESSLVNELKPHKAKNPDEMHTQVPGGEGEMLQAEKSGYLQKIDFAELIDEAARDNLIIRLDNRIGSFVFRSTSIFTYWNPSPDYELDENKYLHMFQVGKNQTELQDIEFSINKFVEIAIRALGNNDPKTATNIIYQIGDLLIQLSEMEVFSPYLTDENGNLRVILKNLTYADYLYRGFASIRHYANKDAVITGELLYVLNAIAQATDKKDHRDIWNFTKYTATGFDHNLLYDLDMDRFNHILWEIAETTGNTDSYEKLITEMKN
ncbi:DUF2254 domain-containing protein [Bacillus haikouensis]|jgi:uncharacterized membrane protein|uniref:DUF2254 domain-containing protein n=1 Tax=Bacillus haikouensis TaxID=1510468 RepID=UPI00155210C2|nr:DUF2254 domain-containing protein [Bacillus haikouensis]NQD66956.1 DUF2254 domain-containing protein [Bacillus haikouensis]